MAAPALARETLMDKDTEDELYHLAGYARLNGLDRGLRWIMRELAAEKRPRPRRKVRVRLPGGGEFWMERKHLEEG